MCKKKGVGGEREADLKSIAYVEKNGSEGREFYLEWDTYQNTCQERGREIMLFRGRYEYRLTKRLTGRKILLEISLSLFLRI